MVGEVLYLTFKKGVGLGVGGVDGGTYILKVLSRSSCGEIIFHPSFLTCGRDPMMLKIQTKPLWKNL